MTKLEELQDALADLMNLRFKLQDELGFENPCEIIDVAKKLESLLEKEIMVLKNKV